MTDLASVLDGAAGSGAPIRFDPSGQVVTVSELWTTALRLQRLIGRHRCVAMSLSSSPECIAVLFAAVSAGVRVVSLPLPARGASLEEYESFARAAVGSTDAEVVFVDDALVGLLPPLPVDVVGFAAAADLAAGDAPGAVDSGGSGFELVQFTSGTTGSPKGIVLSEQAILSNVSAIADRLSTDPSDVVCSWLPLSHDMGLIGILLTSLYTVAEARGAVGTMTLISPEWFVRRPESWFEVLSETKATITAGPEFGLQRAIDCEYSADLDLSSLRALIAGAEPLRPATFAGFEARFAAAGLGRSVVCPAYGLAEACVAVTLGRPDEPWDARDFVLEAGPGDGERNEATLVACGRPLDGHGVAILDDPAVTVPEFGRIEVAGPSLMDGYVGAEPRAGALVTEDLGAMVGGELYVLGRDDEILAVAGRNLSAAAIQVAAGINGVRHGTEVAVIDPSRSGYVIVLESEIVGIDMARLCHSVRSAANGAAGLAPNAVIVADKSAVPRTSSGKPRRHVLASMLAEESLAVRHIERFR